MKDKDRFDMTIDDLETPIDPRKESTGQLTHFSVELFEELCKVTDKNDALGIVIEALSETLGNMISLVKEDFQQEVTIKTILITYKKPQCIRMFKSLRKLIMVKKVYL